MARTQRDTLILVGLGVVAVLFLGPLLVGALMMLFWTGTGGHMAPGTMGGSGGVAVTAFAVVVVPALLVVLLAVWAWRRLADGDGDAAHEELRLALARGDISREEYERRRELLSEDRD